MLFVPRRYKDGAFLGKEQPYFKSGHTRTNKLHGDELELQTATHVVEPPAEHTCTWCHIMSTDEASKEPGGMTDDRRNPAAQRSQGNESKQVAETGKSFYKTRNGHGRFTRDIRRGLGTDMGRGYWNLRGVAVEVAGGLGTVGTRGRKRSLRLGSGGS